MAEIANDEQLKAAVKKYFNEVKKIYNSGSRNIETTYNNPIIELFKVFGCNPIDVSGGRAKKKGQNIDIELWRADDDINGIEPFGAIEVKKVGGTDQRAREQIATETKLYGNVILTDNAVWEFYCIRESKVERYTGVPLMIKDGTDLKLDEAKIDLFIQLIKDFILADPTNIKSSNKLAQYMAEYARTIRVTIKGVLEADETKPMYNDLLGLLNRLKKELLPDLSIKDFADMYAQTIVYGLFIARYNDKSLKTFSLGEAIVNLSEESVLLKEFFSHITTKKLHPTLNDTIDKLCKLYTIADLKELLDKNEVKDTIIHFYEEFLGYYDMAQRKAFGAYYTPVQVVRYMVSMVDKVLTEEFSIKGGLSNNDHFDMKIKSDPYQNPRNKNQMLDEKIVSVPQVAILDPACGTGTFGAEIIKFIKNKYFSGVNEAFYKNWIQKKDGLLSRLIGFEIMMTSYVVAHLKIRRTITETLGAQPDETLPSNIFLTNTLAEPKGLVEKNMQQSLFDFSGAITEEAEQADKWKARRPIKVIIGNPPYKRGSKNEYDYSAYKTETDGVTDFKERKHALDDDYVKFIRFSEQHIERNGSGVLAFITNNGYLDNTTFRGMRASLLRTFDKIYILNLHGEMGETTPDGLKDENVFEITRGISIIVAIKTSKIKDWARVYQSDLYGLRQRKFEILEKQSIRFTELDIDKRMAYFIPQNNTGKDIYESGVSLTDLFAISSTGADSGNDEASITMTKTELQRRLDVVKNAMSDEEIKKLFGRFGRGMTANQIQKDVLENGGKVIKYAFRAFDDRWIYYSGVGGWFSRTRFKIMRNFLDETKSNIGLVFARESSKSLQVGITNKVTDIHLYGGVATIAPLYIAPTELINEWTPNFNTEYLDKLTKNLKTKPSAIGVFDYCYGVLHDPIYREKYNEFLKRDYPKVPVIENEKQFEKYKAAGEKLRKFHLMQTDTKLNLQLVGTNLRIEQVKFLNGELAINKETKIIGIPQDVWEYCISSYQILADWFKSHKGEELTPDSFDHIQKVAGILAETIKIQESLRTYK